MTLLPTSRAPRGKNRLCMKSKTANPISSTSNSRTACTSPRKSSTADIWLSGKRNSHSHGKCPRIERRAMNEPIQEKTPKPPGLVPKNVQSWLLISLALLMVLIMWLTGGKKPQPVTKAIPPAPMVQAPLEVNDAKIAELQNRIQELQREQLVAENALAQPNHPIGPATPDLPQSQQAGATGAGSADRPEDVIRAE